MPKKNKNIDTQSVGNYDEAVLSRLVVESLQEKKALDLCELNFKEVMNQPLFDTFILCSATSRTHADALCDHVMRRLYEQLRVEPVHCEGREQSEWILIDYFNVVVHIFLSEKRRFYDLEGLWNDASVQRFE